MNYLKPIMLISFRKVKDFIRFQGHFGFYKGHINKA